MRILFYFCLFAPLIYLAGCQVNKREDRCRLQLESGIDETLFDFSKFRVMSEPRFSNVKAYCEAEEANCEIETARILSFFFQDTSYWFVYSNSSSAGPSLVFCEDRTLDS